MAELEDYSKTAASNNATSPDGWPENMAPSGVNNSDREFAAAVRTFWEGIGRNALTGLGLSNAADADHDITIAAGFARDSANAADLLLTAAMTKQIDATWAAGSAAGGLFTGAVGNTTWYHVFLIKKTSDNTIDAGFDTSVTAANIPAGYAAYRRLGAVLTNGSANIVAFTQVGDVFLWTDPPLDINGVTVTGTTALQTLSVPLGVRTIARIVFQVVRAVGDSTMYLATPDQADEAAALTTAPLGQGRGASAGLYGAGEAHILTNTSSQIQAAADGADRLLYISTSGWIDSRGKDT